MHHRPSGPPFSARLTAAVARLRWHLRVWAGPHTRRLAVVLAATAAVSAVLLTAPVMTGPQSTSVTVDSSSSRTSAPAPLSESSTAWPAPGSSSTSAAVAAPGTPEQPVAATTADGTPTGQATTLPPATASAPAGDRTPAAAEGPSEPSPAVTAAGSPAAGSPAPAPASTTASTTPASTTPAASATPAVLGAEAEVLALVNQHRRTAGCAPLAGDEDLAAVARAHSADMRDQGYFAHDNLAGDDPFARASRAGVTARAENIARGQQDAAAVVESWMGSAGHRANILDCSLERLGVGMATGAGGPWWTQLFG